jgi:hypothetical protein
MSRFRGWEFGIVGLECMLLNVWGRRVLRRGTGSVHSFEMKSFRPLGMLRHLHTKSSSSIVSGPGEHKINPLDSIPNVQSCPFVL